MMNNNGQSDHNPKEGQRLFATLISSWRAVSKRNKIIILLILFVVAGWLISALLPQTEIRRRLFFSGKRYSQVFTMVDSTISKSAMLHITLPPDIARKSDASITFFPNLEGQWLESDNKQVRIFKPSRDLVVGRYYSVIVIAGETKLNQDFRVVENPSVAAVFPRADSETHEQSEVTIMFNRPMVPLTTLDELEVKVVPVTITPQTEGKFRWISTRNLQFIPKERLFRSANYLVDFGQGFSSVEGLPVAGKKYSFQTRPLRVNSFPDQGTALVFDQPFAITFNQPVDLARTAPEVSVFDQAGKAVDIMVEYGTKEVYDEQSAKSKKEIDTEALYIYQRADQHGRSRKWNYDTGYRLLVNKAYPTEGDINMEQKYEAQIPASGFVKGTQALSERDQGVTQDRLDPAGQFQIDFYEPVNIQASRIRSEFLSGISYPRVCADPEADPEKCKKKDVRTSLLLAFDKSRLQFGQEFKVVLEKIAAEDGAQINNWDVDVGIKIVEPLVISKAEPLAGDPGAELKGLVVCSNNPLQIPKEGEIDKFLRVSPEFTFFHWDASYKVGWNHPYCTSGEYHTYITYGLTPNSDQTVRFAPSDVYGFTVQRSLSFKTGTLSPDDRHITQLQQEFSQAVPKNVQLTYRVENLPYVDIQVCEIKPEQMLFHAQKRPDIWAETISFADCAHTYTGKVDVTDRYWQKKLIQIDLKDYVGKDDTRGHYIVTLTHPEYKRRISYNNPYQQAYLRTYLSVSNLSITQKYLNRQYQENPSFTAGLINEKLLAEQVKNYSNLYWIVDTRDLRSVAGASVEIYTAEGNLYDKSFKIVRGESAASGADGIARASTVNNLTGVVARTGEESALLINNNHNLDWSNRAELAERVYLYTDRPIYRPGHEVFIKGIYRIGYDGSYEIYRDNKAQLIITDSRQETVHEEALEINAFGTFKTKYVLPEEAKLGTYRICAFSACQTISVEEFAPAAFEVELRSAKDEYISGDQLLTKVEASYFFGVPVEGGDITYSLLSQDYYFDKYQDEYFDFGIPWYFCDFECEYREKFLLRKTTRLGSNGKGVIKESLELKRLFEKEEERTSKIIVLQATVQNPNGDQISARQSVLVHAGEYYIGVKADKPFVAKNEAVNLRLKTVNTEGKPTATGGLRLKVGLVRWVSNKRQEVDGGYYHRWVREVEPVLERGLDTDNKGDAVMELKLSQEGEYEVVIEGTDRRGNIIRNRSYIIYVYGDAPASVRPTNDSSLDLTTDRNNLNVGDKARVIIKSPFGRAKGLITVERGQVFSYEALELAGNLHQYEFTVKEEHIPNIDLSALLVSADPAVKFGRVSFSVERDEKELTIDVRSHKKDYLPGETVELAVKVTDSKGRPVSAELSLAVVDASVLALKGNQKKNPVVFFYDGFPLAVQTSNNLTNLLKQIDIKPGKGGGGGDSSDLTRKQRGEFADTALWRSQIVTNSRGEAKLAFTLPDNLTRWQVESVGVTKDTKLGAGYEEFSVKKRVMVTPLQPRFVIPADRFSVGAKVFNQTERPQKLVVSFESKTLQLRRGQPSLSLNLRAGETKTIYFALEAPKDIESGAHHYILSAKNPEFEDTVEKTIPITRNETFETTATANYTKDAAVSEYLFIPDKIIEDRGELKVRSSATLAVFLSDALREMIEYPYGCTEQIASRLATIAVLKRASNIPNVPDIFGLQKISHQGKVYTADQIVREWLPKIYDRQNPDGGFTYYNWSSSFYLTVHVVNVLVDLREAGYEIKEDILRQAREYLENNVAYAPYSDDRNLIISTAYALDRIDDRANQALKPRIKKLVDDQQFLAEQASSLALAQLAMVVRDGYGKVVRKRVFDTLENRLVIDSRGAFIDSGQTTVWQYYETPIKNTALALKAFVKDQRDNELLGNMLRWLLLARDKKGTWGSTNNTLTVVDAFTDYLLWQKESEAEFDLSITLAEQLIGQKSFSQENIFEQYQIERPMQELPRAELSKISFSRQFKSKQPTNLYYDMALRYFLPAARIPGRDEGFTVERAFYRLADKDLTTPIAKAEVGEVLRGRLKIYLPQQRNFVAVEDPIPAGVEIINLNLATADQSLGADQDYSGTGNRLEPSFAESHDDRIFLFTESLSAGVYEYDYFVRVAVPGEYQHLPALASEMYFPENFGRTRGKMFIVTEKNEG